MKKDNTSAITIIRITLVEPPKLKATILSLSVSEAEVRILSFTWGVDCPLHIPALFVALPHYTTV